MTTFDDSGNIEIDYIIAFISYHNIATISTATGCYGVLLTAINAKATNPPFIKFIVSDDYGLIGEN